MVRECHIRGLDILLTNIYKQDDLRKFDFTPPSTSESVPLSRKDKLTTKKLMSRQRVGKVVLAPPKLTRQARREIRRARKYYREVVFPKAFRKS